MPKMTAIHAANVFLYHWFVSLDIPDHLLTNNDSWFVITFFATLCRFLGLGHLSTTANDPPTSGRVKRYTKTTVVSLRNHFPEHVGS